MIIFQAVLHHKEDFICSKWKAQLSYKTIRFNSGITKDEHKARGGTRGRCDKQEFGSQDEMRLEELVVVGARPQL